MTSQLDIHVKTAFDAIVAHTPESGPTPTSDVRALTLSDTTRWSHRAWLAVAAASIVAVGVGAVASLRSAPGQREPLASPPTSPSPMERVVAPGSAARLSQIAALIGNLRNIPTACGQQLVAVAPRVDGNNLALLVVATPAGTTDSTVVILDNDGKLLGTEGGCGGPPQATWAVAASDQADGQPKGTIDVYGRTAPSATHARVTFTSGAVVIVVVQSDGYFLGSLNDYVGDFQDVKSVDPIFSTEIDVPVTDFTVTTVTLITGEVAPVGAVVCLDAGAGQTVTNLCVQEWGGDSFAAGKINTDSFVMPVDPTNAEHQATASAVADALGLSVHPFDASFIPVGITLREEATVYLVLGTSRDGYL